MPRDTVASLVAEADAPGGLALDEAARARMAGARATLAETARRRPVYGLTRGFGPLAEWAADPDTSRQGRHLLDHLTAGQGEFLPPRETRLMVWLRLRSMALGLSGADPLAWERLAEQWNAGFVPAVPEDGSLSASGDLLPLAHAAQAAAGHGTAWTHDGETWTTRASGEVLRDLRLSPVEWEARTALSFVNGTAAGLARTMVNHLELTALSTAVLRTTARIALLLGMSPEPFSDAVAQARGHSGHQHAARTIRHEIEAGDLMRSASRPLQEPYSVRCAPQVVGTVLDQLRLQESVLVTEATGCTDNPIVHDDDVVHGGNFHAAPVAMVSEQYASCVHQVAYLAERQLAQVLDPAFTGGLPPMLAWRPGENSGLAGVQMAATSLLAAIRQHAYPASCTTVPSNLGNQDHTPLALNSANAVSTMLDRAWLVVGSLCHAVVQLGHHLGAPAPDEMWHELCASIAPLTVDRPLSGEIRGVAAAVRHHSLTAPSPPHTMELPA
ncbi:aromatic amino acid ammonia-lyase [Myceligenerans xiligouense]|uniref:Histidine ammonia-lyase n=1 Tax=Myceligenerans xiligouense TaxID=253184 RepID=A0A3N4Z649_9MICO|nr:aromatic amino acid ammonia-lyase [Myceligenerans xiligouense]RPF20742.1 histidine ammonia-lyase [Myceligenerans xiligouense]